MKRTWWLAVVFAVLTGCATDQRPAGATIRLFDGASLAGWSTWLVDSQRADPRGVFSVANGLLRISGEGMGYLATTQAFTNFRLRVDWRWGATNSWPTRIGKARDSGIFVHVAGPDGNSHDGGGAFRAGLECNLFEGAVGDLLLIRGTAADGSLIAPRVTAEVAETRDADGWFSWRPGGRLQTIERWGRLNRRGKSPTWEDRSGFVCPSGLEPPAGQWNRSEIESRNGRLRLWLNGTLVNEMQDVWPREGSILLQCEGSEISFRRVELTPLDDNAR